MKKTLICFTTNRPKTTSIVREFARGVNKQDGEYHAEVIDIDYYKLKGIPQHADAVMSLGILRGTGLMFQGAAKLGLDRYFLDHAYFDAGYNGKGWMRLVKNRHTMNWLRGSEGKRWAEHFRDSQPVTEWRTGEQRGRHIIVCPPTDAVGWYLNCRDWESRVVEYLKTVLPPEDHHLIVVRRKPGGPVTDNKGNLIGKESGPTPPPFDQELETANFLVVHNSMVALEATRKGYPVVTDVHNSCYSISNTWDDILALHNKEDRFDVEPNRRKLFYWLADNQFTLKELKSGNAWLRVLHTEPPAEMEYSEPF